jgi:4-amino-4-deoxy-L-arabinose transferase-like glycosyltransferase
MLMPFAPDLDFQSMNLLVMAWGGAAVLALFAWCRPRLGGWLALLVALALWLNPGFQRFSNQVVSDVPGLACLLFGLLAARWADVPERSGWRRELVLGVVIGLGAYIRSALGLLVPAVVAARAWRQRPSGRDGQRRFAASQVVLVVVVIALQVPWSVRNASVAPEPPVHQTRNYSYATAMFHKNPRDPGSRRLGMDEILGRVPTRAGELAATLGSRLSTWGGPLHRRARPLDWPVLFLATAALCAVAWRRREAAEIYALGYLALLLVYFGYHPRLAIPARGLSPSPYPI